MLLASDEQPNATEPDPADSPRARSRHPARGTIGAVRLLIVDDNRPYGRLLYAQLNARGYECRTVAKLEEARAAMGTGAFDLYVVDIHLPDGDGRAFAAEIQKHHAVTARQILLISSEDEQKLDSRPQESGAKPAFLAKPFGLQDLLVKLREMADQALPG
jgi:DNA-binding response OmpR family regulator